MNKSRRMIWVGLMYKILVGRPARRWMDIIKIDLEERGWEGVYWIYLAQDRGRWRAVVNTVMNLRVPQKWEKF
jgi:hypothetical protein